jgi:hypothetical protein
MDLFRQGVATKPFIYLSAGVSNAEFTESLELAAEAGHGWRVVVPAGWSPAAHYLSRLWKVAYNVAHSSKATLPARRPLNHGFLPPNFAISAKISDRLFWLEK